MRRNFTTTVILFILLLTAWNSAIAQQNTGKLYNRWQRLCDSVQIYLDESNLDAAFRVAEKAAALSRKSFGGNDSTFAISVGNLAALAEMRGDFPLADKYYKQALQLNSKVYGKKSIDYASILENYAIFLRAKGDYRSAQQAMEQVLAVYADESGINSLEYGAAINTYAGIFMGRGMYRVADSLFTVAANTLTAYKSENPDLYLKALNNLAILNERMGKYDEASVRYDTLLRSYESDTNAVQMDYAQILNNYAFLNMNRGRFEVAEPQYKKALVIWKKVYGDEHPEYATALGNIAELYYRMGRYTKAQQVLEQSAGIRLKALGEKHPDYAISLNSLGQLFHEIGEFAKAESLYNKSVSIFASQETIGKYSPQYALVLNNLASVCISLKKFTEAERLLLSVETLLPKTVGLNHPAYATCLNSLGEFYELSHRFDLAGTYYRSALQKRMIIFGESSPQYAKSVFRLAKLLYTEGKNNESNIQFRQLLECYRKQIARYFPYLSEREKAEFYATLKDNIQVYNSFCLHNAATMPELLGDMLNYRLFTKGLIVSSSRKMVKNILQSGNDALITKYAKWLQTREYLAKLYTLPKAKKEETGVNVDSLESFLNDIEKELSQESAVFGTMVADSVPDWRAIRAKLGANEGVVEVIRLTESSNDSLPLVRYAFLLVTQKTVNYPKLVLIENGAQLENSAYSNYIERLQKTETDTVSYQVFWKPVMDNLPGINRIYLSPDGVYNKLDIEALPIRDSVYVIDSLEVKNLTNLKDLLSQNIRTDSTSYAALFGFPNYGLAEDMQIQIAGEMRSGKLRASTLRSSVSFEPISNLRSLKRTRALGITKVSGAGFYLNELPGTKTEVELISDITVKKQWMVENFIGDLALEEAVKGLSSPKVLHIATHGFFMPDVRGEENFLGVETKTLKENPLLRSGLFLSGAVRSINEMQEDEGELKIEDGVLTGFEAMNLDLENTELVVLSACETGLGEVDNGEGVYGLQRAFTVAGAKTVIMSLWKVDDQATQELMQAFYQYWVGGVSKANALKQAKLEIRKKFPHPFYWGAFIISGVE